MPIILYDYPSYWLNNALFYYPQAASISLNTGLE